MPVSRASVTIARILPASWPLYGCGTAIDSVVSGGPTACVATSQCMPKATVPKRAASTVTALRRADACSTPAGEPYGELLGVALL